MHMADALISPAVGGVMFAATAGLALRSARRIRDDDDNNKNIPLMGVMGAFVFAAQMINFAIPGTGSSGHLGGGLLLAILLGPYRAFLTLGSVLLIQALFFADGGLLAYGCNLFNLGFPACFLAYPLIYLPLTRNGRHHGLAAVLAAVVAMQLSAFGVVAETVISGMTSLSPDAFLLMMQPIHLAIGVVEGLATAAVVAYVGKVRPDLLGLHRSAASSRVSASTLVATLGVAALIIGCFVSWFASSDPDGLEWSLERVEAEGNVPVDGVHAALASLQERTSILPDYDFKEAQPAAPETASTANFGASVSGLVGGALTLALALATGFGLSRWRRSGNTQG